MREGVECFVDEDEVRHSSSNEGLNSHIVMPG